jgi:hypothetical protein
VKIVDTDQITQPLGARGFRAWALIAIGIDLVVVSDVAATRSNGFDRLALSLGAVRLIAE